MAELIKSSMAGIIGKSKVVISVLFFNVTDMFELKVMGMNCSLAASSIVGSTVAISDSVINLERTRRGRLVEDSRPSYLRLRLYRDVLRPGGMRKVALVWLVMKRGESETETSSWFSPLRMS